MAKIEKRMYIHIHIVFFFKKYIYFWLCWVFVAVQGLSSSYGKWGLLFVAAQRLLTAAASLVAKHRLQSAQASVPAQWGSVVVASGL